MNFSPLWIVLIALLSASFIAILIVSKFFTKPIDDMKFSFWRIFPFEVAKQNNNYTTRSIFDLFVVMSFSPVLIIANYDGLLLNINSIILIASLVFGLSAISFIFLIFFDVTHVKAHLIAFSVFLSLIILGNVLLVIYGLTACKLLTNHGENPIFLYFCAGIAVVFALFAISIALNPKLMNWAKLDKVEGSKELYKRPSKFPLAYSEWALFLLLYLSEITLFVELTIF